MEKKAFESLVNRVDGEMKIFAEANRHIRKVVKENMNELLAEGDVICSENYDESICIAYDGGNHPEYASNVFSEVSCIYKKDGEIYLDTEDVDEVELNELSTPELITVIEYVVNCMEADFNNAEED